MGKRAKKRSASDGSTPLKQNDGFLYRGLIEWILRYLRYCERALPERFEERVRDLSATARTWAIQAAIGLPSYGDTDHGIERALPLRFRKLGKDVLGNALEDLAKRKLIHLDDSLSRQFKDGIFRIGQHPEGRRFIANGRLFYNIAAPTLEGATESAENGASMTQKIEVKDSPGTTVNQFIGPSNRASQNQAKDSLVQQGARLLIGWFSRLLSRSNKPKGT